jgi:hypothetical protein
LHNEFLETFRALKALGWLGKYVRKVLEVVATRGYSSKAQIEKLLQKEAFSKKTISLKIISKLYVHSYFTAFSKLSIFHR